MEDPPIMQGFSDLGTVKRLGLFGGTFNPIHTGHLFCAQVAMDAKALDRVVFMPAGLPNLKHHDNLVPVTDRLRMCELAVASNAGFTVSDLESSEDRMTYTADTLKALRRVLPSHIQLFFILGADSLLRLHQWHDFESIAQLADIICLCRPGFQPGSDDFRALESVGFRIDFIQAPALNISSTEIRERIQHRESVRYLVPEDVWSYIESNGLYAS